MGVSPHFLNHGHLCFFVCWNVFAYGIVGASFILIQMTLLLTKKIITHVIFNNIYLIKHYVKMLFKVFDNI